MSKLADEKWAVFNRLAARFENCDVGGDTPLRILLLERTTDESVATVPSISGLEPFESLDNAQQQYIAAASKNDFKTNSFQKWHGIAKSAGDEFHRALLLSSAESKSPIIGYSPDGVIGWLISLAQAYRGGYLRSPIQMGYVEHEKWLLASQFQQDASNHNLWALQYKSEGKLAKSKKYTRMANAYSQKYQEIWKEVLNAGIEYYFEDIVTASALWATWVANNDSPYGDLKPTPIVEHNVVVTTSRSSGGVTLTMDNEVPNVESVEIDTNKGQLCQDAECQSDSEADHSNQTEEDQLQEGRNGSLPIITKEKAEDYLPFSVIKAQNLPTDLVVSDKVLRDFLVSTGVRMGNPVTSTGVPNKKRLLVHIVDFVKNIPELRERWKAKRKENNDDSEQSEVEHRKKILQKKKKGSEKPLSSHFPYD